MKTSKFLSLATSLVLLSCSSSKEISTQGSAKTEAPVWQDLRIQTLLPRFMVAPAIEPYLPENFVAVVPPRHLAFWIFWGPKDVLEACFQSELLLEPTSPIIRSEISMILAQKDEDSFVGEESLEERFKFDGAENVVIKKWKWGPHPVLSCDFTSDGQESNWVWIGLNYNGMALLVTLMNPPNDKTPSPEAKQLWSDFLTKTKPLEGWEFLKSKGQDLREGVTLVNLEGSILEVYAEKRVRDGQVQIAIKSVNDQLMCDCLAISQDRMDLSWHHNEPIIKITAELETTEKARKHILQNSYISVLLKEVKEFSFDKESSLQNDAESKMIGDISVLNFCKPLILLDP